MRKLPPRLTMLLVSLGCTLALSACQPAGQTTTTLNDRSPQQHDAVTSSTLEPAGLGDLDLGQDWDAAADRRRPQDASTGSSNRLPRRSGSVPTSDDEVRPTSVWVVVLGTFSGPNHATSAANMRREVRLLDPTLADAWVRSTDDGSIVALGRFDSANDPAAQTTLDRVKSISISGRPVFRGAMLSRVSTQAVAGQVHPHSLLAVRQRYPNVEPLYSLDVALWMADDEGSISYAEARRRAVAYTQQLRAQGYEAYFHHDDDKRMSTVTVGLFDYRAVDPQSGLLSTDVMALRDRFPARLVNGEVLRVPLDPKRPSLGAETQKPFLVLVPD